MIHIQQTRRFLLLAVFSFALGSATCAADTPLAFIGARLIPIEGQEIDQGVLLVDGDKIIAVGAVGEVEIPGEAQRIDVSGKVIMPGLICTHSHIGGVGAADGSGPIQPGVRVFESIDIHDAGFRRAIAGG